MTDLTINQVYAIGAPIVLAMILIEVFFSSIYNKNLYKKDDTLCTIGLLTGNILMVFALKGITLALHFYLFQFKLFNLSALMPVWALWILTFVMIDLVFYFYHRISHRVNFLWAIHMLWGIVGHTQIVGKLGPLEWIFNTPSHHRVHHGANCQYIDKNYGNLLIIWDRMFGTFEPEDEPVKFGLVRNVNTFNPTKITFMGWIDIFKNMKNASNLSEAIYFLLGPPKTKN